MRLSLFSARSSRNPLTGLSGLQLSTLLARKGVLITDSCRNPLTGLSGLQPGGVYGLNRAHCGRNPLTGLSGLQRKA